MELLDLVIADLRKRKASKPGRLKTLLGTIRAVCGKELPESKIDSVFKSLVKLELRQGRRNQSPVHWPLGNWGKSGH